MKKTYDMKIAGLDRSLPLCAVSEDLSIAAFILFGDVEITVASAAALLEKAPAFDVLVTAEAKSIPLIHEMARQSGHNGYIVARKGPKVYMTNAITVEVHSITTQHVQTLSIGAQEASQIAGRRVLIIDDVISTGESLAAMEQLVEKAGGNIVGKMAVLAEGDAAERDDIIYLEKLPLFHADGSIIA